MELDEIFTAEHRRELEAAANLVFTSEEYRLLQYTLWQIIHGMVSSEPLSALEVKKLQKVVSTGEKFLKAAQSVDDDLMMKITWYQAVPRLEGRSETVRRWCSAAEEALASHKRQKSGERYTARQIFALQQVRAIYDVARSHALSDDRADYAHFLRTVLCHLPSSIRRTMVEDEGRQLESVVDYATKKVPAIKLRSTYFQCAELNEHLTRLKAEGELAKLEQADNGSWRATLSEPVRTIEIVTQYLAPVVVLFSFKRRVEGRAGEDTILSRTPTLPKALHNEGWTGGHLEEANYLLGNIEDHYGSEIVRAAVTHLRENAHWLFTAEQKFELYSNQRTSEEVARGWTAIR